MRGVMRGHAAIAEICRLGASGRDVATVGAGTVFVEIIGTWGVRRGRVRRERRSVSVRRRRTT